MIDHIIGMMHERTFVEEDELSVQTSLEILRDLGNIGILSNTLIKTDPIINR